MIVHFGFFFQKSDIRREMIRMKSSLNCIRILDWQKYASRRIPRDFLMAIGGWEKNGPSKAIEIYDIHNDEWRRVAHLEDERCIAYHQCFFVKKVSFSFL